MTTTDVISSLEACSKTIFTWFDDNYMKASSDKSHFLLTSESDVVEQGTANINMAIISNSKSDKLATCCNRLQAKF